MSSDRRYLRRPAKSHNFAVSLTIFDTSVSRSHDKGPKSHDFCRKLPVNEWKLKNKAISVQLLVVLQEGNVRLRMRNTDISCINKDDLEVYTDYKQINEQKMIPFHYVTDLIKVNNQKKVFFAISRFFFAGSHVF